MTAFGDRRREPVSRSLLQIEARAQHTKPLWNRGTTRAELVRPIADELLCAFARNHLKVSPYQLLLIGAITLLATTWINLAAVLPGALLAAASVLVERSCCRALMRRASGITNPSRWRLGFVLGELVQGAGWFLFAVPFLAQPPEPPAGSDGFLLIAVLLLTGVAGVLRSPLPSAVGAALAPLALVLAFLVARGSDEGHGTLALLFLSGQIFIAHVSHRLHRAAAANVRACAEVRVSLAEIEQITASMAAAYRRAEEADRAKTQFFATMSHELRTPLNAILGFSEVMKNEVLGTHSTPSYREYSIDIHGSGQRLLTLVNGILDLSRIASGQYALREETAELGALVSDSVAALSASASGKDQEISLSIAMDLDPILVDVAAVRQIVAHLVSNAIKFTAPGGQITVCVGWTSSGAQYVSVADDGPGIPADEIPVVLSSFGRGSLALSTAEPGVGLGLPIARGLLELHGGRLSLRSTLRKGTEAVAIFPAVRCRPARRAPSAAVA